MDFPFRPFVGNLKMIKHTPIYWLHYYCDTLSTWSISLACLLENTSHGNGNSSLGTQSRWLPNFQGGLWIAGCPLVATLNLHNSIDRPSRATVARKHDKWVYRRVHMCIGKHVLDCSMGHMKMVKNSNLIIYIAFVT